MSTAIAVDGDVIQRHPQISECPTWCIGPQDHDHAMAEGCRPDEIRHMSEELIIRADQISNPHHPEVVLRDCPASISVQLIQPAQPLPFGGFPCIAMEVSAGSRIDLELTTAEARSIAAMLLHLADQHELHAWERDR